MSNKPLYGTQRIIFHDGSLLATGDRAKTIIYDVKSKTKIYEFKHDHIVHSVSFSNDGRLLATGDYCKENNYIWCNIKDKNVNLYMMMNYIVYHFQMMVDYWQQAMMEGKQLYMM